MKTGVELLPPAEAVEDCDEFQEFTAEIDEAIATRGPKAYLELPHERRIVTGSNRKRASVLISAGGSYIAKQPIWGPTLIDAQATAMNVIRTELANTASAASTDIAAPAHYAIVRAPRGTASIMEAATTESGSPAASLYALRYDHEMGELEDAPAVVRQEIIERIPKKLRYLLDDLFARNILCSIDPGSSRDWRSSSFTLIDQCHSARAGARLMVSRSTAGHNIPSAIVRLVPGFAYRLVSTD